MYLRYFFSSFFKINTIFYVSKNFKTELYQISHSYKCYVKETTLYVRNEFTEVEARNIMTHVLLS